MQQMMQFLMQQQQVQSNLLQHLFHSQGKGKSKGSKGGGNSSGDGADLLRTQMLKPETAPIFSGKGYEIWKKSLKEWEDLHYAVDEYQKPGLLMRALQGEALAVARAELTAKGLDTTHGEEAYEAIKEALQANLVRCEQVYEAVPPVPTFDHVRQ